MVKKADNLRKMIDWVESDLTFSAGKEMILCSLLRYLWTELFIYYIPIASKVFLFFQSFSVFVSSKPLRQIPIQR